MSSGYRDLVDIQFLDWRASDRMLRRQLRCGHASGNYIDIASARSSGRLRFRAKFTPRSFIIADYLNFVGSSVPLGFRLDKLSKDNPRLSPIISGNSQDVTLWLNLKTYDFRQRFQVKLRKVLISIYFFIKSEFFKIGRTKIRFIIKEVYYKTVSVVRKEDP